MTNPSAPPLHYDAVPSEMNAAPSEVYVPYPADDPAADRWLVEKARDGSSEAFEVLIHRHRARVYRTALRIVGNRDDADDIAQDVFVLAWTALASFAGQASFSTWLYRIVINRSLSHTTRKKPTEVLDHHEPITTVGPEDVVIARQRVAATAQAIADLPAELRVVFVLHQTERLSYREVGAILNLSDSTVRGRLARARRALLDQLREWS